MQAVEARCRYLGQMDLNLKSPLVWEYYRETLKKLAGYGAAIVRLDAFAYAPKEPGRRNFMNEPETWDLLEEIPAKWLSRWGCRSCRKFTPAMPKAPTVP